MVPSIFTIAEGYMTRLRLMVADGMDEVEDDIQKRVLVSSPL